MKTMDWKKIMVTLPLLALGLPVAAGAEAAYSQTASVSYRAGEGTRQEAYSGYEMAVEGSTLTLDLKGTAAGENGWSVEDLDPAMVRLDSQTVSQIPDAQPKLAATKLCFTALKPGKTQFQIRQKGSHPAQTLEVHLTVDKAKQIASVNFTRPEARENTGAALESPVPAKANPFRETHEGHLIRSGFTGEAYSDNMVLLHLDLGMTRKDVEKLAKKMDCRVQYYMPMLSMAALKLDKPVQDSREMRKILDRFNGTTGVIMADVDRIMLLE